MHDQIAQPSTRVYHAMPKEYTREQPNALQKENCVAFVWVEGLHYHAEGNLSEHVKVFQTDSLQVQEPVRLVGVLMLIMVVV